jgi:LPS export ABC transporter protein LptC
MIRIRWKSIVVLGLTLLCLAGCSQQDQEIVSSDQEKKEHPSQEGWNSQIYLSKAGRLQAVVRYGHMMKFEGLKVYQFDEGVVVDFYDDEGEHTSHLTSNKGEYHEATEDVIGRGNVVVVSDSGLTLRTDVLRWDNGREKIISDTLVMLTTPDYDTLYGVGFESNADLTRRVIRKPWGVSDQSIDFEKFEDAFTEWPSADTVVRQDTVEDRQK